MISRLLALVAGIIVAIHGAFGFLFANRFRREALVPAPPSREFGVWVSGIEHDQITLASNDSYRRNHPGVLGLFWPGGYGHVTDLLDRNPGATTRRFQVTHGSPPSPGTEVDLDAWAYPSDPSDVGLEWQETSFESDVGRLGAWLVPGTAGTWAIHIHGWRAARQEAIRMLPTYQRVGITSMVIDYRNDAGAPVDPSGHYRFGLSEWIDVEAAVTEALANGATDVILSAYSTGAAAAFAFMERSRLAKQISGLALDAPNINMAQTVHHAASEMRLPLLTVPMPRSVTAVAMFLADLRWGVDWEAINYLARAHWLDVPILVFHGTADRRVPVAVSRALRKANPERVELVEVPGAGHVSSWNADPPAYEARLEEFLGSIA